MFTISKNKQACGFFLILALAFCAAAYGASSVRALFNPNNFVSTDSNVLTEKFWGTPSNKLYDKSVAEWDDDDFMQLDVELRRAIYKLSISNNPYRNLHISRLQSAVDLVPSFKLWAKRGKDGIAPSDTVVPIAGSKQDAQRPQPAEQAALTDIVTQTGIWQELNRSSNKYIILVSLFGIVLGIATVLGVHLYKRSTVRACPKCKTRDKKMLSVGTYTFKSLFMGGKRRCYCGACGYKWIQH